MRLTREPPGAGVRHNPPLRPLPAEAGHRAHQPGRDFSFSSSQRARHSPSRPHLRTRDGKVHLRDRLWIKQDLPWKLLTLPKTQGNRQVTVGFAKLLPPPLTLLGVVTAALGWGRPGSARKAPRALLPHFTWKRWLI